MIKTKIKKVLAIIAISALASTQMGNTFAATQIGTGSVTWTASFDTNIMWDDNFPGTASGSISGVVVTANIAPTLNMTISTGAIDLGTLSSVAFSTGSLDIEIGTNAVNGVVVTARSGSGGLTSTSSGSVQVNNLSADGAQDNYLFTSNLNGANTDTNGGSFVATAALSTEVTDNSTEHVVYSSNRPEENTGIDDIEFSVSAQANAMTPAGNYQDTITFTVTGSF